MIDEIKTKNVIQNQQHHCQMQVIMMIHHRPGSITDTPNTDYSASFDGFENDEPGVSGAFSGALVKMEAF